MSKGTILVVDDRPANRYAIVHTLKRSGYTVSEAESGQQALELAKQNPSAILLDVKLPDILGYEVCRRLKANPKTSHIPVLQLSAAFFDNESRVYALESGADAYLTQPVEPNVLLATVKSLVKLHEAETLAKISAKQWQSTFDALSEGVALVDETGKIQRCNRAMSLMLERSYAEIEGKNISDLFTGALTAEGISEKQITDLSFGARHYRGRLEPILFNNLRTGSIFVLSDITQQKLAEHAAILNERLAATGKMAHTIAHEINNPLEAITNIIYLLQSAQIGREHANELLVSAEEEVARVSRITRQILSFHRESSVPVTVNLSEIIENVLALNNRAVVEKQLRVTKRWDSSLTARVFPAQLRQVLSNVFRNAIEASSLTSEVLIRVSSSSIMSGESKPAVRVSIADRGSGILEDHKGKIFEAFFTTKELKGTGLGLWLSASIIQQHSGRIQVKSRVTSGRSGTVVSILLPRE
jgi:signal transduction histidine kinase/FixJ family two-component response regulator